MKKVSIFSILLGLSLLISCGGSKSSKGSASSKKTTKKSSTSTPQTTNSSSKEGENIVKIARSYIGTKYKYGGITRKGMDCSGLAYNVYKDIGVTLPRSSSAQSEVGKRVYIGEVVKGDLIFFGATKGSKKITHIGIVSYSNNGTVKMIHASSSKGVREDTIDKHYWKDRYIKACRPLEK